MTHSQEREQRKLAYYVEPQNGALKRNVRHILGISDGKDSATLFMGDPSVISRQFLDDIPLAYRKSAQSHCYTQSPVF